MKGVKQSIYTGLDAEKKALGPLRPRSGHAGGWLQTHIEPTAITRTLCLV
jgi:hypothetical protein